MWSRSTKSIFFSIFSLDSDRFYRTYTMYSVPEFENENEEVKSHRFIKKLLSTRILEIRFYCVKRIKKDQSSVTFKYLSLRLWYSLYLLNNQLYSFYMIMAAIHNYRFSLHHKHLECVFYTHFFWLTISNSYYYAICVNSHFRDT